LPRYDYAARDKNGKKVTGELTAASEDDLNEKLSHSGLILISAQAVRFEVIKKDVRLKSEKVLRFTNNLSFLIKGGLRLLESLNVLGQDTKDEELASLILGLRDYIEAGGNFKGALQLYPKTFSKLYISMVEAGEKTGKLGLVLEQVADYLEWQLDLRARIKELATYPAIIFVVMVLVVSVLMGWVLPKFEPILQELGTDLPLPTKIVLDISHFFTRFWYLMFGGIIGLFLLGKALLKNKVVQLYYDAMKLNLPILGQLINNICQCVFAGRCLWAFPAV
jgi:type IV pilus assembly protein PilC